MASLGFRELGEHSKASSGPQLRKTLVVTVTTAVGISLPSCSAQQPSAVHTSAAPPVYEHSAPVIRAPLSLPPGYDPSPGPPNTETSLLPHATSHNGGTQTHTTAVGLWTASPRWTAIRGHGCIEVEQDLQSNVGGIGAQIPSPNLLERRR